MGGIFTSPFHRGSITSRETCFPSRAAATRSKTRIAFATRPPLPITRPMSSLATCSSRRTFPPPLWLAQHSPGWDHPLKNGQYIQSIPSRFLLSRLRKRTARHPITAPKNHPINGLQVFRGSVLSCSFSGQNTTSPFEARYSDR